jgi:hypothetical protein
MPTGRSGSSRGSRSDSRRAYRVCPPQGLTGAAPVSESHLSVSCVTTLGHRPRRLANVGHLIRTDVNDAPVRLDINEPGAPPSPPMV